MGVLRDAEFFLVLTTGLHILWAASSFEETTSSGTANCKMREIQFNLGTAIEFANKAIQPLRGTKFEECPLKPEDCNVLFNCGKKSNGVYTLWPKSRITENSIQAYCDMETDGGGWTVIQRRGNFGRSENYFYQGWNAYKEGFGDPSEDFWIGNDMLFGISNQKKYSIRFDLKDGDDNERWATYDHFWIDSEDTNYTLHVSGYKGNAGDSFSYHSGQQFSTMDRDNDKSTGNCAVTCSGAWWYNSCYKSNLNALYLNGYHADRLYKGINWSLWRHNNYSLPFAEMKIKPLLRIQGNPGNQCTIPH